MANVAIRPPTVGGVAVERIGDIAEELGSFFMLYSKGGDGKTTLAGSLRLSEADSPVLFIDAEGGSKVIKHLKDIDVLSVDSWDQVLAIKNDLLRTPPGNLYWKTVVIDNLSEIIQLATNKIVGNATDQTSQPKYGTMAREIIALVRDLRNVLARKRGVNLVVIAWDSFEKDELAGRAIYTLRGTPMLQRDLPGIMDHIAHIESIDGHPEARRLKFENSARTISKLRASADEAPRSIPGVIDYTVDKMPLVDVVAALRRGVKFPVAKYPKIGS